MVFILSFSDDSHLLQIDEETFELSDKEPLQFASFFIQFQWVLEETMITSIIYSLKTLYKFPRTNFGHN